MDRSIPRGLESRTLQIDSAFRRDDEPVDSYRVYFDSFDKRRARTIKDVVGLHINRVSLPRVHDNVVAGLNVVNVHLASRASPPDAQQLSSEAELVQYLSELNPSLVLSSETKKRRHSHAGVSQIYQLTSNAGNQLLTSESPFPGATLRGTRYCLLVSASTTRWDVSFPVNLSLVSSESFAVRLKPGFYPTPSLLHAELVEELTSHLVTEISDHLQYQNTAGGSPGWSVVKIERGRWKLRFESADDLDIDVYVSREPGRYDMLDQLGLRSHGTRDVGLFAMTRYTLPASVTSVPYVWELQFEPINLAPRRYVDVVLENIPGSQLITNSASHRHVFARVDLSRDSVSYTSSINASTSSDLYAGFEQASLLETYVTYENVTGHRPPLFDPISLDHLGVTLVDNLGHPYTAGRDHTMEIELTVIGDATVPFDFPVAGIGSVSPPRRALTDLPEYAEHRPGRRRGARQKKVAAAPPQESPSPITNWVVDNRLEVGASTLTFFTVLYVAYRAGAFDTAPPPTAAVGGPPAPSPAYAVRPGL